MLDKLSVSLTGEELNIIEKLYHQAMKLEIEFFYAQPLTQPTVVPLTKEHDPAQDRLMLFSDFDLTCTVVDSSAVLAEIAIVTAPKSDQNQPEGRIARMLSAELRNTWDLLSRQFTEEYEQCIESILPSEKGTVIYCNDTLNFNYMFNLRKDIPENISIGSFNIDFYFRPVVLQWSSTMKPCLKHLSNSQILRKGQILE